jgi:hypothetical protein
MTLMKLPRLSRRQQAGLAVALALLMWAPQGISHGDHTVVTGHSTFYNGDAYDPCLASIAGIMRSRVLWFNDQVLVEHYGGKGTYIYVTEAGAPDPRDRQLRSEGVFYDFVDPNGAHWHVEESYMAEGYSGEYYVNDDPVGNDDDPPAYVTTAKERTYVWTVELSSRPIYDQFAGADPHTYYNFLTLVDTCKMHRIANQTQGPNATHDYESGLLNDDYGHENGADEHEHETWFVDIWVGKRPTFAVGGVSTDGANWQSQWAATEANESAAHEQSEFEGYLP